MQTDPNQCHVSSHRPSPLALRFFPTPLRLQMSTLISMSQLDSSAEGEGRAARQYFGAKDLWGPQPRPVRREAFAAMLSSRWFPRLKRGGCWHSPLG